MLRLWLSVLRLLKAYLSLLDFTHFYISHSQGLFGIFKRKKHPEYYGTRRRAQSTTSHYSVEFLLNNNNTENRGHNTENRGHNTDTRQQSLHNRHAGNAVAQLQVSPSTILPLVSQCIFCADGLKSQKLERDNQISLWTIIMNPTCHGRLES